MAPRLGGENEERRHLCRRSPLPGHQRPNAFSARSPQLVSLRKAEVSSYGSLDSHWHRPLHITSFLSEMMLQVPELPSMSQEIHWVRERPVVRGTAKAKRASSR